MADGEGAFIDRAALGAHLRRSLAGEEELRDDFVRQFVWRDPRTLPRRDWLYSGHYIRKFITATFSPGGSGKSILAITEALAMATGRPLLGVAVPKRLRVAYWNGEDPLEETDRRVLAVMLHFNIMAEEVEGWLFVGTGREGRIVIAEQTRDGTVVRRPHVDRVKSVIQRLQLDAVIVDPFVSSHRVTENDNGAVTVVCDEWKDVADSGSCSVELVHHTTKAAIGRETKVEDGRGGGALLFAVRSARALNTMSTDEAEAASVPPKERRWYFRVDNGKANLAPPPEGSAWFRFRSVDLGNVGENGEEADSVGAIEQWEWPDGTQQPNGDSPQRRTGRLSLAAQAIQRAYNRIHDEGRTTLVPLLPGVKVGQRGVSDGELRKVAVTLNLVAEPRPAADDKDAMTRWQAAGRAAWKTGVRQLTERGLFRFEDGCVWAIDRTFDHADRGDASGGASR